MRASKPAAGKAGIAPQLAIGYRWPGLPERIVRHKTEHYPMKRTLHFLALVLLLSGCKQQLSDDARRQQQLTGTWRSLGGLGGTTNITTVRSDGHYSRLAVGSNGVELARCEGMFKVQDGWLVDTMTTHPDTSLPLPYIVRAAIVRVEDREWTLKWHSRTETTMRKEGR